MWHRQLLRVEKRLYLPQTRTMYLSGMKYRMTVNTQKATMASQLKNGTVQLNVLNEKLTHVRSVITSQNRIYKNNQPGRI